MQSSAARARCCWVSIPIRPELLPDALGSVRSGGRHTAAERAAAAVRAHCIALVDAAAPACVGVKLQLACFERLGAPGWAALADVAGHARGRGPARDRRRQAGGRSPHRRRPTRRRCSARPRRRGDRSTGLGADAVTANPLLGRDSLEPIVDGGPGDGARGCSCWCGPRTPARLSCRTTRRPAASHCASAWPRSWPRARARRRGGCRALRRRRGGGGDRSLR